MKKLFNSESDRNLWIKLNAERQIKWEKNLTYFDSVSQTYKPTLQEFDEEKGKLRFTFEELLSL